VNLFCRRAVRLAEAAVADGAPTQKPDRNRKNAIEIVNSENPVNSARVSDKLPLASQKRK